MSMLSGRIGRLGFFLGYVYLQIPSIILLILYLLFNMLAGEAHHETFRAVATVTLTGFGLVWAFAYFFISMDLNVRRWHDINQTGSLAFLYFVPGVNLVAVVVQLVVPGNPEINQYGRPVSGLGIMQVLFHKYPVEPQSAQPTQQPPVAN